ncbi:MAG: transposase [Gammaproteobacteria bacterium]
MGETKALHCINPEVPVTLDTFAGKVEVIFDQEADCTPMGQLPFFIDFLKTSGLYDAWLKDCPLDYTSPNAPSTRDVLGTILLSVLAGHRRYAHINGLRHEGVNPELLGMSRVLSEDAIRNAVKALANADGLSWVERHLDHTTRPLLAGEWVLDVDASVKPLYGHQEGAVLGYNPKKPGRPCHALHSAMMAQTRLVLSVEMRPGNESASKHALGWLERWLNTLPRECWPALTRGDVGLGTDDMMCQCERLRQPYLFKLRRSAKVKQLVKKLFQGGDWTMAGAGWSSAEARLKLLGWERDRRVVVLRRAAKQDQVAQDAQGRLHFMKDAPGDELWEYVVLVTDLTQDAWALSQLYRDRADCENHFDELKNQWGWGGFVTKDLDRSRLMTRLIALIYNWWTIYARLAGEGRHQEALTSRPELMNGVARMAQHAGKKILRLSRLHAVSDKVIRRLRALARWLKILTSEQLSQTERLSKLLTQAFIKLLAPSPPLCLPNPA